MSIASSDLDEVKKWKRYTIVVAVGFVIIGLLIGYAVGYIYGLKHGSQMYLDLNTFTDNINKVFLADYSCMEALDTARATAFLIDIHGYIYETSKGQLSENNIRLMQIRQRYFADRTVTLLDTAYESVNEIKSSSEKVYAKLEVLKSKIQELKNLASELRTIAYKDYITLDDRDRAMAIIKNMERYSDDIHDIAKEVMDILYHETIEK